MPMTLLALVERLSRTVHDEEAVAALARRLVNTGAVVLVGNFRGATFH